MKSNIHPVNIIHWGILPGLMVGLITFIVLLFLPIQITGSREEYVCSEDDDSNCYNKKISNKYNILIYIFLPLIFAFIVGSMVFKLGIMVKNPKFGVGVVGAKMLKNAITE